MTKAEEKALLLQFQAGDQAALDKLIKSNLKFVVTVSKRYQNQGVSLLDIIQEGASGMVEAAKRFDTNRDLKFFSYAIWWIKIKILDTFDFHKRLIDLPANRSLLIKKVKRAITVLEDQLLRYPTADEIQRSKYAKKHFPSATIEDIEEALGFSLLPVSLFSQLIDKDGTESGSQVIETLSVPNDLDVDLDDRSNSMAKDLDKLLYQLPQRHYDVIALCFGLNSEEPKRNEAVAKLFGLKDKDVVGLKSKAVKILQKYRDNTNLNEYL